MNCDFENKLNSEYRRLEGKCEDTARAVAETISDTDVGWFSGHYHKDENGNWCRESYPIPVIALKGLCDAEIHFDRISVSTKLTRERALAHSFANLDGYDFEAYGVEDYLCDFRLRGQDIRKMKENIRACAESEIGFSFFFPFDTDGRQIAKFAKLLRDEGFYY